MDLEPLTQQVGGDLLAASRDHAASSGFFPDRLMSLALRDEALQTQLFRLVDVFPMLTDAHQVQQHIHEYLGHLNLPPALRLGMAAGKLFSAASARLLASQIRSMAGAFIAGEDLATAQPVLREHWKRSIAFSVDLLGEACVSQPEALAYRERYRDAITTLASETRQWPAHSLLDSDHLGPLPRASVSIKISSLDAHLNPADLDSNLQRLQAAITPLLQLAAESNVQVYFDMEQHELKELTFSLFFRCCEAIDFPAGIALQTYLKSADEDAARLIRWSQQTGRRVSVRLIKGAYWDYEVLHAQLMSWPSPVWEHKALTDACFERLAAAFVTQIPLQPGQGGVKLAVGSHNIRSIARTIALCQQQSLPPNAVEFQMLRGMADEMKHTLAARGYRVREYVPIGQLIPGMAYLVRRLLENSSNQGFIRHAQLRELSDDQLLAPPLPANAPATPPSPATFTNEPHRDFSNVSQRTSFARAVAETILPAKPTDVTLDQADRAVAAVQQAFPAWSATPPGQRCDIIRRAASFLRTQRDRLSAIMIRESAKPWAEADADVCEAIDFCEFYAREAEPLFHPQPLSNFAAESNYTIHEPRGPAVVISPWNFPLAICTGMTVAALVTGNPVLLKPAEQSPIIAHELCLALWQSGIPRDVLHYLPGPGHTIGHHLVREARIALIAFTGSSAVGLDILHAAAPDAQAPTLPLKHVICEMGGKNAIIVDSSANLDEAVIGVRDSAFSYAGQKCSACSRVIVLDSIYDTFLRRLTESTQSLICGDPVNPATDMPPVIDAEGAAKIRHYLSLARAEAASQQPQGNLIAPHILTDLPPDSPLLRDEIFGPVLCVLRARDIDHALELANASSHKLTGGIYSRTPSHLEKAQRDFHVGNLYLNRPITGATVGRQPFGGLGLSGLGTQAGGREYLLHFVFPRTITEKRPIPRVSSHLAEAPPS